VEDAGNGSTTDHITEEIGINVGGGNNRVAAGVGQSSGIASRAPAQQVQNQSNSFLGMFE